MDVNQVIESLGSKCQYEKLRFLGGGSFGVVYKAKITDRTDYTGDQMVAVKAVPLTTNILENNELFRKLKRKLSALLALEQDHVVAYHKATFLQQFDGLFLELLMDYYSGGDLSHLLKGKALLNDEPAVVCYAMQLADGMKYLHSLKIIHGDIKPGNILVKPSEHQHHILAIGDSDDYVQIQGSMTSKRDITHARGTLRYMSPEMVRRYFAAEEVVGRPTDVWSLGCVILDLANASRGSASRDLYKLATDEKMEIEGGFQWDMQYVNFINTGWTPFIAESVSDLLGSCIRSCFMAVDLRIKSADLLENLMVKVNISTLLESGDTERDCLCKNRAPYSAMASIEERVDPETNATVLGSNCLYNIQFNKIVVDFASGAAYAAKITVRGNFAGEDIMVRCFSPGSMRGRDGKWLSENIPVFRTALTLKHAHLLAYHKAVLVKSEESRVPLSHIEMVMDYVVCDGDLAAQLTLWKEGFITDQLTCVCYAAQLADALEFLHENHVIHGNLNPVNIFVHRIQNRHCRLLVDFFDTVLHSIDLKKRFGRDSDDCPYMSPEMCKESAGAVRQSVSCRTDIWSLGCIILEMAHAAADNYARYLYRKDTGERFLITQNIDGTTIATKVFDGFVPYIPKAISKFLGGCIQQCLRVYPAYRISARDMLQILREAAATADATPDTSGCECRSGGSATISYTRLRNSADLQPTAPREVVLFYHYAIAKNRFGLIVPLQWYDPVCATLRPLPLRGALLCRGFLPIFLEMENEIVCMIKNKAVQNLSGQNNRKVSRIEIIKSDFLTQTWEHLSFINNITDANVKRITNAPIVINGTIANGAVIYIWTDFEDFPLQALDVFSGVLSPVAAPMLSMPWQNQTSGPGRAKILFYQNKIMCCADDTEAKWMCYYDIVDNKWEWLPDMIEARVDYAVTILRNHLFIFGGKDSRHVTVKASMRFSMERRSWVKLADLSIPRRKHGSFMLNNKIYVFGGVSERSTRDGTQVPDSCVVLDLELYDPELDTWSNIPLNLENKSHHVAHFIRTICVPVKWTIANDGVAFLE